MSDDEELSPLDEFLYGQAIHQCHIDTMVGQVRDTRAGLDLASGRTPVDWNKVEALVGEYKALLAGLERGCFHSVN